MGCQDAQRDGDCEDDEKPPRPVSVSDFSIGRFEVTQAQWRAVMDSDPSYNKGCDDCPVEQVSWNDVQDFLKKLNEMTGKRYRLPTEAEWEYAARGGNKSKGYLYSGSKTLGDVAWYNSNSGGKSHPVGKKAANELGLHDMSGNVLEWCSDWYGSYPTGAQNNPTGADKGAYRVYRGGSWGHIPRYCRAAGRGDGTPAFRGNDLGFRLARS
jgi:formylglycine-generating enzyme